MTLKQMRRDMRAALTCTDVVEDDIAPVPWDAALQSGAVQVEAVNTLLHGVIVEHGQVTGDWSVNKAESQLPR